MAFRRESVLRSMFTTENGWMLKKIPLQQTSKKNFGQKDKNVLLSN